jgi:hypothetical protein
MSSRTAVSRLEKEIQQMRSMLKTNTRSSNDVSEHESGDEESDEQGTIEEELPPPVHRHSSTATTPTTINELQYFPSFVTLFKSKKGY